jgi:class 3 adenylate cyclase/tetratricopeptide (TPR) repeat protein
MRSVREWLASLGLSEYADRFAEHRIDFSILRDLTDQDLKDELGVVLLGDRQRLLRAIAELAGTASAAPPLAPGSEWSPRDEAERRQVTVMFADLVGSTALSTGMDPEDLREVISAYQKCVAETVRQFGGFVARYVGDGVLVYFGYPHAHEDDAERAVRAGLELITRVAGLNARAPLRVRVGIATGLVVVGHLIQSGESEERGMVGETPNLAARLQGIAEPNMVVIAEGTRRLLGNLFELEDLGPQDFKGIAGQVRAWAVLRASSAESRFEAMHAAGLTALVGREEEFELLRRRWSKAKSGEGQVVLLSGEAGIGKSRLTAAVMELLAGEPHTHLRYFCSPQHTNSALHPIIGQIERAAGLAHDDAPQSKLDKLDALLRHSSTSLEDTALIAEMLSLPNDGRYPLLELAPRQRRERTLDALIWQMETLSSSVPLLMVFEDAHWADPTSLEVFGRTVRKIPTHRVLLIVTFRPEFEPPWIGQAHATALTLNPLAPREVGALIDHLVGNKLLPASIRQDIIERTDGMPLFVEEMTKAVLEAEGEGKARRTAALVPSPALAVPASLHASLMARLDRLAPVKEIGQIGATIGREFSFSLLRAVVGGDETALQGALAQLEHAEIVFRRGEPPEAIYSFKHALLRDAAYESVLRSRRQALHGRIAETLRNKFAATAETEPELIAHHFTQAGLAEAAVEWWGKAGERAMERSAFAEAIAHLEKGIELAKTLADEPAQRLLRLRLQITYGYALLHAQGQTMPETIAAFARARELAAGVEDIAERFSAYYGLWAGSLLRGELAPMREVADIFLREVQRLPESPETGVAHRVFGITRWYEGDYVAARLHLEQAVASYDYERDRHLASRFGYDPGVVATFFLGLVLWPLGEVDRAAYLTEKAFSLAVRCGSIPTLACAHTYTSAFAAIRRKSGQAIEHARALLALAREHELPQWLMHGTFLHGWARWCGGDLAHHVR